MTRAGDRNLRAMTLAVLRLLRSQKQMVKADPGVAAVWERTFRAGAVAAQFSTRLDVINVAAVAYAQNRSAQLVADIDASAQAAIRAVTASGLAGQTRITDTERMVAQVVGLDARRAQAVANYRVALAERTGGVLSSSGEAKAARFADRMLRDRAETIARTETLRAAHQGELANWRDARDRGTFTRGTKRWLVTPDDRTCPECAPLDGVAVDMDGDWTSNAGSVTDMPPVHPQCRCTTTLEVDL